MRKVRPIFVAWRGSGSLRAFTLVELLVVIAIIGILAALLLPALSKSKTSSQSILCANHMHQIAVATMVYDSDNRRLPSMIEWLYSKTIGPAAPAPPGGIPLPTTMDLTKGLLYPYVQSKAAFVCPSETRSIAPWGLIDHSYQVQCNTCHAHDPTQCLAPARTVYFLEATNLSPGVINGLTSASLPPTAAFRHAKREHFVFMDAHFEKMTRAEYNGDSTDPRFWSPNNATGLMGNP